MLIKVTDAPGFVKNTDNQAIISTDNDALKAYRARRRKAMEQDATINSLNQRLHKLEKLVLLLLEEKNS